MREEYIEMHDAIVKMKLNANMNEIELKRFTEQLSSILSKKQDNGKTESEQLPKQKKVRDRPSKI
jgi:hypothetical protein